MWPLLLTKPKLLRPYNQPVQLLLIFVHCFRQTKKIILVSMFSFLQKFSLSFFDCPNRGYFCARLRARILAGHTDTFCREIRKANVFVRSVWLLPLSNFSRGWLKEGWSGDGRTTRQRPRAAAKIRQSFFVEFIFTDIKFLHKTLEWNLFLPFHFVHSHQHQGSGFQ